MRTKRYIIALFVIYMIFHFCVIAIYKLDNPNNSYEKLGMDLWYMTIFQIVIMCIVLAGLSKGLNTIESFKEVIELFWRKIKSFFNKKNKK